jgi:Zn-finger nucleic acid-binding protein
MAWHHLDCWSEGRGCGTCRRGARRRLRAGTKARPACPRCPDRHLEEGVYEDIAVRFCPGCWGVWVPLASLGPLLLSEGLAFGAPPTGAEAATAPRRDPLVPCGACDRLMDKWRWSGLLLDACPGHGLWLDGGELERLQALAAANPRELYDLLAQLGGPGPWDAERIVDRA